MNLCIICIYNDQMTTRRDIGQETYEYDGVECCIDHMGEAKSEEELQHSGNRAEGADMLNDALIFN